MTDYQDESDNLKMYENGEKTFTRKFYNIISKRLEKYKCSEIPAKLQDELFERLEKLKNTLPTILELPEQKWVKTEEYQLPFANIKIEETQLFLDITSDVLEPRRYLHPKLYFDDWKPEEGFKDFALDWCGKPFKNENGETIWVKENFEPPPQIVKKGRKNIEIRQPDTIHPKAVNMLWCYGYYI
jgi:hypothetical protein